VLLFDFMASKQNVGFAPVFQPLLGPIDEAAENLLLARLGAAVPVDPDLRERFFEAVSPGGGRPNPHLVERGRALKRLLVDHAPIMPIGVLLFCLDYQPRAEALASNVFAVIAGVFSDIHGSALRQELRRVYEFRNTYVAHEKGEELTARHLAEEALHDWIDVLVSLEQLIPHGG
jgi:type III restriction enzyme